jgi:DNA-binding LacI/PurR family transcriptional regulator/signal transduction histidine kinase
MATHLKGDKEIHNGRPTIGLLVDWLEDQYQTMILSGVADIAQEQDANLICWVGGRLRSAYAFDIQRNTLYDLVNPENADGLVILTGALSNDIGFEATVNFCKRYRPLPMVSVSLPMAGIPSVLIDNEAGLREAITHLIQVHHRRRIAFIRGPEYNSEAEQRYQVYAEVLAEHDIPLDPNLVATGDFNRSAGTEAIHLLLDQRQVKPDAVVAANDLMATYALQALQARKLHIPNDIAVVGFDDIEEGRVLTPPLTTVRQHLYEQGKRACEMLLGLLNGEAVPEQVTLPTELVVRQSCGCLSETMLNVAASPIVTTSEPTTAVLSTQQEVILAEMVQTVESHSVGINPKYTTHILSSFIIEIAGESPGAFLAALDEALRQTIISDDDVDSWQSALSVLRRHALSCLGDSQTLIQAENLFHQARVLISEIAKHRQTFLGLQAERVARVLDEVSGELITHFDLERLTDVTAQELPRLGINACYISLYEQHPGILTPAQSESAETEPEKPNGWSWLVVAYDEQGRVELKPGGQRFPTHQLAPGGLLPVKRQYTIVVQALYFRENQLGLALFEMGPREGRIYERLRSQLSSALQGTLLLTEHEQAKDILAQRAAQLSLLNKVGSKIAAVSDLESVLNRTVNLIRDTFGYHRVTIFTLDHEREELVMGASADESSPSLPLHHQFKLGQGMVGWSGRHGETLLANDVKAEPRYLTLGPEAIPTRAELSVPIRVGEEIVGVLDIQSPQLNAFDENDVLVMETLADQVAVAIQNARLYEASRQELTERKRAEEALEKGYAKVEMLVKERTAELQQEIIERRRAEEALAQQAQELALSLEQFAYVASHDLQTPLRQVASYAQLLQERYGGKLDEDADEFIGYAVEGAARMHRLINDLLAYWKVTTHAGSFSLIDCAAVLNQVLFNLRSAIEECGATVTQDDLPTVMADPFQLALVFQNLIDNAIKFHSDRLPEIHVAVERTDGQWLFSVRDNGPGIESQYFERIFMVFQRLHTQGEYEGTGIGLAICKKIVERHQGRIWVESALGHGSTFYFTIPDRGGSL